VGNTELKPEKARTTTFGIVLQPAGTGLQFSADYYHIKLTGGLALALGGPAAVTACHDNNDPFFCSLLTFGPPRPDQTANPNSAFTNITGMKTLYTNQNPYIAKGLDFSLSYRFDAEKLLGSMPGSFAVNFAATHMLKQSAPVFRAGFVPGQADLAGQTGGDAGFLSDVAPSPDWSGNVAVSYMNGPFTTTVQTRFVNSGHIDQQNPKTGPDDPDYDPALSYSVSDNTTPKYFVVNLNASMDIDVESVDKLQVFASINNFFDKNPPFSGGGVGGANAINYDTLGRSVRFGVRMKF
jgi:iron complex outermembrane receptor protein